MFDYITTLSYGIGRRSASSGRRVATLTPALKEIKPLILDPRRESRKFPKEK
jgi:hypothetical protein